MTLLGCELKRPSLNELTAAVAIGVALWLTLVLTGLVASTPVGAGSNLVAIVFGCFSNACGISVTGGWRPLLLNISGCALVLVLFNLATLLF